MTKSYKLWLYLEEIDDDPESYEDLGWPDPMGTFDTEEDAHKAAWKMVEQYGTDPDGSDHQQSK